MSRRSGTHTGHCQACGRRQVLTPFGIAKHGYVVAGWGFFNGVCHGAGAQALELDRTYTDKLCAQLRTHAEHVTQVAGEYLSGVRIPLEVRTGRMVENDKPETWKYLGKWVDEFVAWSAAEPYQRQRGVDNIVSLHENDARRSLGHVKFLTDLAARVHGQPLTAREHKPAPRPVQAGDVFIWGTAARYRVEGTLSRGKVWCVPLEPIGADGRPRRACFVSLRRVRDGLVRA